MHAGVLVAVVPEGTFNMSGCGHQVAASRMRMYMHARVRAHMVHVQDPVGHKPMLLSMWQHDHSAEQQITVDMIPCLSKLGKGKRETPGR